MNAVNEFLDDHAEYMLSVGETMEPSMCLCL